MALYYLDTSALVKRYVREVGTAWVTALTDPRSGNTIATGRLTGPEAIAALYRKSALHRWRASWWTTRTATGDGRILPPGPAAYAFRSLPRGCMTVSGRTESGSV